MATRTYGTMGADREHLARAKQFVAESDLRAILCFDMTTSATCGYYSPADAVVASARDEGAHAG
jgi:hypothetical protein